MTFLEALVRTMDSDLLARPVVDGWRGGYYIGGEVVYEVDPLQLASDLKTLLPRLARLPPRDVLLGEWETVERGAL